jgi:hypothetical protein
MRILDIPFRERPAIELLALDREDADPEYAGYGWAKLDRVWLESPHWRRRVDDVLVLAIHAADDGAPREDDVELDFEVDEKVVASADATAFLAQWLPQLPTARHVVLVMCNPHRARLATPAGVHHGIGDVRAWLDPGDRIRFTADAWRMVPRVSTELEKRPGQAVSDEDKHTYAGLYILKKMDLKPEDGGLVFPGVLPADLSPLDELLQALAVEEYVDLNTKKNRWDLTKKGIAYLGRVIDEATDLMDEFDDDEMEEVVEELEKRGLDPMRARFIWGWYDGEFDDLVQWQEQRGVKPVERMWAFYLMSDEFYRELANEIGDDE